MTYHKIFFDNDNKNLIIFNRPDGLFFDFFEKWHIIETLYFLIKRTKAKALNSKNLARVQSFSFGF
ncbi:hypothetical protein BGP_0406 [Beggiatoa sp. PS]|nr:hypothetical protein BGP_0406 [Beggiatoa sp. PS]